MNPAPLDTPWRRLAALFFRAPQEPILTTTAEIDVEAVLAYAEAHRRPGVALRPVHFFAVAAARALAEDTPHLNGYVRRGRIVPKADVSVVVTAMLPGRDDVIQVRLGEADLATATQAETSLREAVGRYRKRLKAGTEPPEYALARLPWPLGGGVYRTLRGLTHRLGVPLRRFDLAPESLGSLVLSDLSRFTDGYDPSYGLLRDHHGSLFPAGHAAGFLVISAPREVPAVLDGAVVPRIRVPLCGTFDHRVVDASHVSDFVRGILNRLQDPEALDTPLPS